MARIKIADIPRDQKISKDELKRVRGGAYEFYLPTSTNLTALKFFIPNTLTTNVNVFPKIESTSPEIKL